MPATLYLDGVQSQFSQQGTLKTLRRAFTIEDMDTSVGSAALLLSFKNVPGMPQVNDTFAADTSMRVLGYTVGGLLPNAVSGTIDYSSGTGLTPSSKIVTTGTTLVSISSKVLQDGTPVMVSFESDEEGVPSVPPDYLTSTYLWPCRTKIIEGLNYGMPALNVIEPHIGKVNADPYLGGEAGSWMIADYTDVYSAYQGQTTYRAKVMAAPGGQKFWTVGVMRNRQGLVCTYSNQPEAIQENIAGPYQYGETASPGNGYSVHGAYKTVNFASLGL